MIGNAVPPKLAYFVGKEIMRVATEFNDKKRERK
jgi:site-specific DNA-cytosine methylase